MNCLKQYNLEEEGGRGNVQEGMWNVDGDGRPAISTY